MQEGTVRAAARGNGLGKDRQRVRQLTCLALSWLLETSLLTSSHLSPQLHVCGGQSQSPRGMGGESRTFHSVTDGVTP